MRCDRFYVLQDVSSTHELRQKTTESDICAVSASNDCPLRGRAAKCPQPSCVATPLHPRFDRSTGLFSLRHALLAFLILLPLLALSTSRADQAGAGNVRKLDLSPLVEYLEDAEGRLSIADVRGAAADRFRPMGDANLGYSKSTFWLRIPLARTPGAEAERLLEVAHFDIDHVAFHAPDQAAVLAGLDYPVAPELWPHRFYVFPLTLSEEPRYYYLQVRSDSAITVPLTLWEPVAFADAAQRNYLALALYFGGLFALLLYNLLIFLSLRERRFLLYSVFAGFMGLGIFAGNGLMRQFLWPAAEAWPAGIFASLAALTTAFALYFTQSFLQTGGQLPRLHRAMHLAAGGACLVAVAPWLGVSIRTVASGISLGTIVAGGMMIAAGALSWRAGNKSARFFLLAWGLLAAGGIVAGLHSFGLLPTNFLTAYAVQLSSGIEMILLSFALAERIRLERNARECAQAETISARQALVDSLRQSEARLERTVAERTSELNQSLQNERKLLDRYVRFGSLIAHEFRNPLAIIKSQLALIDKERQRGLDHSERRLAAISSAAGRLGVLFEEWLQSDRLRQADMALSLSTIPLAGWLKDVVDDCRDCYPGFRFDVRIGEKLPDMQADEAMLKAAIHNLIDNAAKYAPAGTTIHVEALAWEGMTGISVIDHGPGIAPEHRDAIFAEYFRAAPDRDTKGLGLGLAFVKRIVELHRGWIELKSNLDEGAGFCLWLPGDMGSSAAT